MEEIRRNRIYRKSKKTTVQLTSLLDLLFVMIFVSLIQQKDIPDQVKKEIKKKGTITKVQISPKKEKKVIKKTTPVVLKNYTVEAIFHFHPTSSNPSIPSGTYNMKGSFDEKTRTLHLGGISWVNRPENYDMVPLSGKIEATDSLFVGRIEFPGCKQFTLKKVQKIQGSPISGTWEGVYDCSQGSTGLTLTIK